MIKGDLAEQARELIEAGQAFVHATVVRAVRPTSVRMGDCALLTAEGRILGFVGGSCAQASVRLHAARALETGEPILLRVSPDPQAAGTAEAGVAFAHNPCLSGGALDIFLDPQLPPPRMLIAGQTPIAQALADIAWAAGYAVVSAPGSELAPAPGDRAVVVASHGEDEEVALVRALEAGVGYVGLVASERRGEAVRAALDVPDALRACLHAPAGLAIDARTPAQIAIAILAEIVAEGAARVPPVPVPGGTAVDPVCGMEVAVADTTIHADVAGERAYFCCEGCRAKHLEAHRAVEDDNAARAGLELT